MAVLSRDVCFEKNLLVTAGANSFIRIADLGNLKINDEVKTRRKKTMTQFLN